MIEVKENYKKVEKAFLVGIYEKGGNETEAEVLLDELEELSTTLEIPVAGRMCVKIAKNHAKMLVGTGKAEEIIEAAKAVEADVIIFDEQISPSQQRNWEQASGILVIDRREVILDIFADRATTKEARLQIELARAEYELPRLTRAWTHLSRQRGGAMLRGEGERQLEVDRRLTRKKIQRLQEELKKVRKQRATQRKKRRKKPVPNAAIVGYTNAGKSSLLNKLTNADILADDKLFATLDPTTKRIELSNNQEMLLTDTVGFIRKLPHDLVEAFKATLEEAVLADFLLHVVDVSDEQAEEHIKTTMEVLKELDADQKQIITVFNKIDNLENRFMLPRMRSLYPGAVFISVKSGEGIEKLLKEMEAILERDLNISELEIPVAEYDVIAMLHRTSAIIEEEYENDKVRIKAKIPPQIKGKLKKYLIDTTAV